MCESTMIGERATLSEGTKGEERAILHESTNSIERAISPEGTKQQERKREVVTMGDAEFDAMTVAALTSELKGEARHMERDEARFLVDAYYQVQKYRKTAGNQVRAGGQGDVRAFAIVDYVQNHMAAIETRIKLLLKHYAAADPVGEWSMSICGIGPVISAGLLAHIDIERAPTVGHIWSFAGLNPEQTWEKGERRPWNARLKNLCWHIGQCFMKTHNNENSFYGPLYVRRKAYEVERNETGGNADAAAAKVTAHPQHKQREIYAEGKLPPGQIEARACHWAAKLFLAHWHHVAYECHYGEPPPKPYIIDRGNHAHIMGPPNWPMEAATNKSRSATAAS